MSYMTPYYFSASAGQAVSVWVRSNNFASKAGLCISSSNIALAENSQSGWKYDSQYNAAAFRYTATSSQFYGVQCSSEGATDTGSFKLYVTPAETSSVNVPSSSGGYGFIQRLMYSSTANRLCAAYWWSSDNFGNPPWTSSVSIIDPQSSTVTSTDVLAGQKIFDAAFNPSSSTFLVWSTGSSGELLREYNSTGSQINSYNVKSLWAALGSGQLAYNSVNNQILMLKDQGLNPTTSSIFDCGLGSIVTTVSHPYRLSFVTHVSSNNKYYAVSLYTSSAAVQIDALTGTTAEISNLTGSHYGISYVSEIDRIIFERADSSGSVVFNPSTNEVDSFIPGVMEVIDSHYNPCQKCLVLVDDGYPGVGGGLCFVATSSYSPLNFISVPGAYRATYCQGTSTTWVANYNNNIVYSMFATIPTASLPQPPMPGSPVTGSPPTPPLAPIFLEVFSGSAILVWESGSNDADYWTVQKSLSDENGVYVEIGTSPGDTLTYRDEDVQKNRTYYYKVAAVNGGGTSSFSNIAAIDVAACVPVDFSPIIYEGYLSYSSGSTYKNIYGVLLPFTTSVSQSISVWARSKDFDTYIALIDSTGSILIENDWDGWQPSGDYSTYGGNSAFTYNLPSGSYNIELSSVNNAIGRYLVYVSPGPRLDAVWENSYETATCEYIPSSNCVVVGEQGSNIVWYYVNERSHSVITWPQGVQGICYSPHQDRVFAWVYDGNGTIGWTASIAEYDNTGSFVGRTDYPRPLTVTAGSSRIAMTGYNVYLVDTSGNITDFTVFPVSSSVYVYALGQSGRIMSVTNALTMALDISGNIPYDGFFDLGSNFQITPYQVTPNPDFSGYLTYDPRHDRIAFYRYFYATNHLFNIWDIPTRTFTASLNAAPYTTFSDMWEGCYSWADDCFYIGTTDYKHLVKVNATTLTITASSDAVKTDIISSYASSSGLLLLRNNSSPGKVVFADPVSESVVRTQSDLPSSGYFEGTGKSGDPDDVCVNAYAITIDPRGGPNYPAIALLDRNTYNPVNYLTLNSDNPGGFAPDGWYQYSIAYAISESRLYSAQVSYDNYQGRLYSIKLSRIREPYPALPPYTSSASDTASCLTFRTEFPISASMATRVMADYLCSTRFSASSTPNTLVVSDLELNGGFSGQHNFNNCFVSSNGTLLGNYQGSYIHCYSGKNAVFCSGKFYMMDDGATEQSVLWEPVDATSMLVFDQSGSLQATIPLTYAGRDWGTDGEYVYVYEYNGTDCWIEKIDPSTDTVSSTTQLQVGYTFTPAFRFFYATASISASTNSDIGYKHYPYFGKIVVFKNSSDTTCIYYNNIYGERVGTSPAAYNFQDSGSGDRIWAAGSTGYALYNYATKLDMSVSPYKKWYGSAVYCPITNRIYWGASNIFDDPILIETDTNLNVTTTHSLSYEPSCLVWNQKDRTIEVFDASGFYGPMTVFDPVAKTNVCTITTLNVGGYGGSMGLNIDSDFRNGDVYVAQRYDGASLTGSVQVYKM